MAISNSISTRKNRNRVLVSYSDGFIQGNGKNFQTGGGTFAIFDITDVSPFPGDDHLLINKQGELLERTSNTYHGFLTNNICEAKAFFELVATLHYRKLINKSNTIFTYLDSELILYQVLGIYKINSINLKETYKNLNILLTKIEKEEGLTRQEIFNIINLQHIPGIEMKKTIIGH